MPRAVRRARGFVVVAAMCAAGCGTTGSAPATPAAVGTRPGEIAPALSGTSLEGHALSLGSMHGSVVVVLFWASWCTPCQAEQPSVNVLAGEEAAHGVHFLGVSVDVDRPAAQSYVRRYAVPYDSLIDASQAMVVDYEVAGPPTTFVIDGRGRVAAELVGELSAGDLRAHIAAALGDH